MYTHSLFRRPEYPKAHSTEFLELARAETASSFVPPGLGNFQIEDIEDRGLCAFGRTAYWVVLIIKATQLHQVIVSTATQQHILCTYRLSAGPRKFWIFALKDRDPGSARAAAASDCLGRNEHHILCADNPRSLWIFTLNDRGLLHMPSPQPSDKDIAPWLETLDEVPPTPPPKESRTFNVSPQTSLNSMRNGSMSSYYYSNSSRHRPSGNLSVSTNDSLELNDSVDDYGQAFMVPELDLPPSQDVEIAPWLDTSPEPPSPPPKNGRSFHFPPKGSFSSLRPGSSSGLFSRSRASESRSNLSIADSAIASTSTSMMHEPRDSSDRSFSPSPSQELRKTKSTMFSALRNKVSKRSLRATATERDDDVHPSLRLPPLNTANGNGSLVSFLPIPSPPQTPRFMKRTKKKYSQPQEDPPPMPGSEPPDPTEQPMKIDMDFNEMRGIVDDAVLARGPGGGNTSSPSDLASSSGMSQSLSDHSSGYGAPPTFNDPWPPGGAYSVPRASRKVSPNTIVPLPDLPPAAVQGPGPAGVMGGAPGEVPTEGWTAPESWSVAVKDGKDPGGEVEESSEDESGTRHGHLHHGSGGVEAEPVCNSNDHVNGNGSPESGMGAMLRANGLSGGAGMGMVNGGVKKNGGGTLEALTIARPKPAPGVKRPNGSVSGTTAAQHNKMRIRIYKADNTYHVVSVSTNVTVAALTPKLDQKLPAGEEREMHQLYLKERGRDGATGGYCATEAGAGGV
ncbi:hypothetical protein K438DRAFT_2119408 [Mycena galopus ATCC 62051]|nr:hypothetical protein K438DRAFT_2119408 [Mycena galopus ATCC 62051]